MKSIRVVLTSALIAAILSIITLSVYNFTKEPIEIARKAFLIKSLNEVLGSLEYNNDILSTATTVAEYSHINLLGVEPTNNHIYTAKNNDFAVGYVVPITTDEGYGGTIDMIIAIDRHGSILGVRVISHRETPGLGDKIELSKNLWIKSFDGKSIQQDKSEWRVKKDGGSFDSFTGATITPRAVIKTVQQSLEFFKLQEAWKQ